jgi:hypothetical protein
MENSEKVRYNPWEARRDAYMNYVLEVTINGFDFQFGSNPFGEKLGTFIEFTDKNIKGILDHANSKFFDALKQVMEQADELDALYTMRVFEQFYLQGQGWHTFFDHYSFSSIEKFKSKAIIALNSSMAKEEEISVANKIIDLLNGNYARPSPKNKTPQEIAEHLPKVHESRIDKS